MFENPFTPSFGEIPAHLAGRRDIVESLVRALESERRRPELTSILSGARGTGKTALLSYVSQQASQRGWIVAGTTAIPGMLEDIELRARRQAAHIVAQEGGVHVSAVGIPQLFDVEFERDERPSGNWRSRMDDLLDQLEPLGTGLLITVDEVDVNLDEMVQLAAVYQHFVREGRKVGLLMAGLPHAVSALLNNKSVSFLRRAQLWTLGRIDDYEVEAALFATIREAGRTVAAADVRRAAEAIGGFPYLMQLVGYRAWDVDPMSEELSTSDIDAGIDLGRREMNARVLRSTLLDLSAGDRDFLCAMLQDEGDSLTGDIEKRLGWSSAQVAQYRRRLIEAGVIGARGRGVVGFDLPFFRDYLLSEEL
jgi:hypothetical protein